MLSGQPSTASCPRRRPSWWTLAMPAGWTATSRTTFRRGNIARRRCSLLLEKSPSGSLLSHFTDDIPTRQYRSPEVRTNYVIPVSSQASSIALHLAVTT